MAAGKVGISIGPFDHPRWLLYFDGMVEEVAKAIEGLSL